MTTTTQPRRPTDAELEEMTQWGGRMLEAQALNLARLRVATMRAESGNEAAEALSPQELKRLREQVLSDQADVAGRLAWAQAEIAFRKLTGEWGGGNHAAH